MSLAPPRERLDAILARHDIVMATLNAGPDPDTFVALSRELAELDPVVAAIREYRAAQENLEGLEALAEDPATGSAAGPFAAALVHHGLVRPVDGVARFVIEQGVDMGRPSRIEAEVEGGPGAVRTVRIAGGSVVVIEGTLRW